MIVGTAGHIDHGKTALVRSLTGVDTDRLKEEKARGISIELGYAYQPLNNGEILGFVDVPGHERFVHTMLAGASGIDFALLVVAADDGVMPQTREHVQILDLLGVSQGAVALTKVDRVDPARIETARTEIDELLSATRLAGSRVFAVSNVTGEGIQTLKEFLHAQAQASPHPAAEGHFRLAVDRCFVLHGAGTVVTGTVFAGEVRLNDALVVSPSGLPARVRSIHAQNRPSDFGREGMRCALNLTGPEISKAAIRRGDWIVAPTLHAPTARIDARVRLLSSEKRPIAHWSPVFLHLGAARIGAHVALLDKKEISPGQSGLAQLVLDAPIGALHGDLFVLRDPAASRSVGGGTVIDPAGPTRYRRTPQRIDVLCALEQSNHRASLEKLLPLLPLGLDLSGFCRTRNLKWEHVQLPQSAILVGSGHAERAFERAHWQTLKSRVIDEVGKFHVAHEDELGPERGRLRRILFPQLDPDAWSALVEELLREGHLASSGAFLSLPGHCVTLSPAEQNMARAILPRLEAEPFDPPWVRDIALQLRVDERQVRKLLLRLVKQGEVFQVVRDLFYCKSAVADLSRIAAELEAGDGKVLAARFRDRIDVGRKRAIQILEFFDRIGYLRRVRDAHRIRGTVLPRESPPAAPN